MMKTTPEVLDAVKEKLGIESDYALAKHLKVTRAMISSYRHGRTFSAPIAIKAAKILGVEPAIILAIAEMEKAGNQELKKAWRRAVQALQATAAGLAVAATLPLADTVNCILC